VVLVYNIGLFEHDHLTDTRYWAPGAARWTLAAGRLALSWVLSRGDEVIPIPGTRDRKHLEDNLGALEITMSTAELASIDAIFPPDAVAGARYREAMMAMVAP